MRIIDLKVLNDSGQGDFGTVGRALQWVAAHAAQYNIVAVNMSFGDGGDYNQPVSLYGLGTDLAALAEQNIIVVSAAGNNYFNQGSVQGVAYPAADPNSLAVGSVWGANLGGPFAWDNGAIDYTTGADQIMSFSQRSATLSDTFAPGAFIQGAGPNGTVSTFSGTSMAAPVVSGVAALADELAMQTLGRRLTASEFRYLLNTTGTAIADAGNNNVRDTGLNFSRVDVEALAEGILALKNGTIPDVTEGPVHPANPAGGSASAAAVPPGDQSALLTAGGSVGGMDFGNFLPGVVSGTVYLDSNGDTSFDNGEAGLLGVIVTLHSANPAVADQTVMTDASGAFTFGQLAAGSYTLSETPPTGDEQTSPGASDSFSYSISVISGFSGANFDFANQSISAPAELAISPDTGASSSDGLTDTGNITLSGVLPSVGLTVDVYDTTVGVDLGQATVTGSTFSEALSLAAGGHELRVEATDPQGGLSPAAYFTVVVDLAPPALTLPGDQTFEATGAAGTVVDFAPATATDLVTANPTITYSVGGTPITNGSQFALGATTVMVLATDAAGNTSTGTFTVTVKDTTAPVLTLPGN